MIPLLSVLKPTQIVPFGIRNSLIYIFHQILLSGSESSVQHNSNPAGLFLMNWPYWMWQAGLYEHLRDLMLVSTRVCNLQPPARQFPLMVFWSSLAPQTRCLLSCQLQLKPSSIPLSAYIMQREFSLRPGSITSWVWSKKKKKQQKIPTVRDWNDAVSAYCGCCTTGAIVACFYKQLIHCGWTLHPGV